MAIINEIKMRFCSGSLLLKLIYLNIGIFVAVKLAMLVMPLFGVSAAVIASAVELPSEWLAVAHRPWTLFTYMLMHGSLMHIFMNMLCLYWFGRVFAEFNTQKQLVTLYVLSGLGGALAYLAAYATLPVFAASHSSLVGASAAVLGIMVAIGVQAPNYRINLLIVGSVAMKWVVLTTLFLMLISSEDSNLGGSVAHIGGIAVGAVYALLLKTGHDITGTINRLTDGLIGIFKKKKTATNSKYHYSPNIEDRPTASQAQQPKARKSSRSQFVSEKEERVDAILEKIKQSGYASLTKEEKEIIFSVGKK